MKILVIGATGGTGRQVVAQALQRGHDVSVLLRDSAAAAEFPDAHVVVGDVLDAEAVAAALAGVDAVISCLGVRAGQVPGTVRSAGTASLVARMGGCGVRRLIAVSTIGVGSSVADQSRMARIVWRLVVGKDRLAEAEAAEAEIRSAGDALDWTIVRPPRLMDGQPVGEVAIGESVSAKMRSELTRTALAGVLLDQIDDRRYVGKAVTAIAIG
ncbi:putative NADH-flavin reductase [Mycobacterium sp. BK086]|uniref:NAD(P)-dependent oxidoreductase n=1 Tax=Mycobacterium sp. BK086 TaxID=2512165 RepID=UPI00105FF9D9|nr:NAD(P)H-binding protein [Mycobacterium sp. BK086]TDO17746.1 putative NADH-flavin reductase [Mycobacterium sp. BK086]